MENNELWIWFGAFLVVFNIVTFIAGILNQNMFNLITNPIALIFWVLIIRFELRELSERTI